jgi:hypothetical protein
MTGVALGCVDRTYPGGRATVFIVVAAGTTMERAAIPLPIYLEKACDVTEGALGWVERTFPGKDYTVFIVVAAETT